MGKTVWKKIRVGAVGSKASGVVGLQKVGRLASCALNSQKWFQLGRREAPPPATASGPPQARRDSASSAAREGSDPQLPKLLQAGFLHSRVWGLRGTLKTPPPFTPKVFPRCS